MKSNGSLMWLHAGLLAAFGAIFWMRTLPAAESPTDLVRPPMRQLLPAQTRGAATRESASTDRLAVLSASWKRPDDRVSDEREPSGRETFGTGPEKTTSSDHESAPAGSAQSSLKPEAGPRKSMSTASAFARTEPPSGASRGASARVLSRTFFRTPAPMALSASGANGRIAGSRLASSHALGTQTSAAGYGALPTQVFSRVLQETLGDVAVLNVGAGAHSAGVGVSPVSSPERGQPLNLGQRSGTGDAGGSGDTDVPSDTIALTAGLSTTVHGKGGDFNLTVTRSGAAAVAVLDSVRSSSSDFESAMADSIGLRWQLGNLRSFYAASAALHAQDPMLSLRIAISQKGDVMGEIETLTTDTGGKGYRFWTCKFGDSGTLKTLVISGGDMGGQPVVCLQLHCDCGDARLVLTAFERGFETPPYKSNCGN